MKRLILIAGPSCAGKTTLISSIFAGNPELKQLLCIIDPAEWTSLEARQLDKVDVREINNLVLHYDIIEQHTALGYKHILELFTYYEDITLITLMASPLSLLLRNTNRLVKYMFQQLVAIIWGRKRKFTKSWHREKLYLNPGMTKTIYGNWMSHIESFKIIKHLIIDTSGISLNAGLMPTYKNIKCFNKDITELQLP